MEMKAQLCPKCKGQGIVSRPPWVSADVLTWSATQTTFQCDVCNGAKILYVPDDAVNFICSLNSKYDLPELRDYVYALKCRQTLKHVAAVQFLPCSNMDSWYE